MQGSPSAVPVPSREGHDGVAMTTPAGFASDALPPVRPIVLTACAPASLSMSLRYLMFLALLLLVPVVICGCVGMQRSQITPDEAVAIALADPEVRQQIAGRQIVATAVWPGIYQGKIIYDVRITVQSGGGGDGTREIRFFIGKDGTRYGIYHPAQLFPAPGR
jgi:hypothetical protein